MTTIGRTDCISLSWAMCFLTLRFWLFGLLLLLWLRLGLVACLAWAWFRCGFMGLWLCFLLAWASGFWLSCPRESWSLVVWAFEKQAVGLFCFKLNWAFAFHAVGFCLFALAFALA